MAWFREYRLTKQQAEATNENLFRILLPLIMGFRKIVAGPAECNSDLLQAFRMELNDFGLHPLRGDIITSTIWFTEELEPRFPLVKQLCEIVNGPYRDSLNEFQLDMFDRDYNICCGNTYKCYQILFLIRRMMLTSEYRDAILFDGKCTIR
jgi:hypothetical protein